jgi:mannose PTS system EIIA component
MIGTLILSHGRLAAELLAAAQVIAGALPGFEALSLDWSDGFEEARGKIKEAVGRLDQGDGLLILTDMFGGTPCNVSLTFLQPGRIEVLTGVNLPMVLRLACMPRPEMGVHELALWLQEKGRQSVCLASETMRPADKETICEEQRR